MAPPGRKLIVITGPTASGKTDLAITVAQELGSSVVSADSRQVYAGMNIGTAKPKFAWSDKVEEANGETGLPAVALAKAGPVPHYLLNIRYPSEPLSLSDWQTAAFQAIDHIAADGGAPLLVGGTMLYIDSIIKNYELPQVAPNPDLRAELENKATDELYAELLKKDPAAKEFIEPMNKRRIVRALEVMAATGQPFSPQRRQRPPRYAITAIGLFDSWEALEERVKERVAAMFEGGLVEETKILLDHYGADLPLLATLNYREAAAVLRGEWPSEKAREEMIRANLKYARRQMSWWRGREDIAWHSPADIAGIKKRLLG